MNSNPPAISPPLIELARSGHQDPLAAAVREILLRALLAMRVPRPDAEDLAQDKTPKVLAVLLEGRVKEPGKEDAYVRRCGQTTGITYFRKTSALPANDEWTERHQDASRAFDEAEENAAQEELVRLLQEVVSSLPDDQRRLLQDVYLEGKPISELASKELEQSPVARGGKPRNLKQARAAIDKRLERARTELAQRLWQAKKEGQS